MEIPEEMGSGPRAIPNRGELSAMDEARKKAFDLAAEVHKQLITLATAIITITISFSKDVFGGGQNPIALVKIAWVLYLASILFGIMSLMAITGTLDEDRRLRDGGFPSLKDGSIRRLARIHVISFLLATLFIISYGFMARMGAAQQSTMQLKVDPLRVDTLKVEPLRSDPIRVEPLKTEPLKIETTKEAADKSET